jgi:MFS family permease
MNTINKTISVLEPVEEAIERTRTILFAPFNLEKWFIIGFCAWLADLFQGGLGGCNARVNNKEDLGKLVEFCKANITFAVSCAIAAVILVAVIILVILWLSSRGKFMFLDCLAKNKAHVRQPWKEFKKQANSLLGFRLLLIVAGFAYITIIIITIIVLAVFIKSTTNEKTFLIALLLAIAVTIPLIIIPGLFLGFVQTLTFDFVAPIMYLRRISVFTAWGEFLPLLWQNFWKIMLYLLFKVLILLCIGAIVLAMILLGCCFCCISAILFIPYIGTVILLPLSSFYRLYALCYLQQFGSEYDVFASTI